MLVARDLWVGPPGEDCPAALQGISLSVGRGEWVAVTGPNGSGKSTLALALAGLLRPRCGTVELDGRVLRTGARERVGVVFQEASSQLLQSTVHDELGFAARNLGRAEAEVRRGIEAWSHALGLASELDRDPRTLSAGRQQLVLLAAAMVSRPDLLVADEVGAHLDHESRARVLEVVRREVDRGLAVVWVTQEPAERAAADRTFELDHHGNEAAESGAGAEAPKPIGNGGQGVLPSVARLELVVSPRDSTVGPGIQTLEPLRIAIGERGVWSIEGRNGTGKTVMLESVAGLRRLAQLRVMWRREMKQPPIVATQSPRLQQFEERVVDEVVYAAVKRGLDRKDAIGKATAHFDSLRLGGRRFLERRCWDLSAGEGRLMHVVAALITPASVVLLDEPTCGLDRVRRLALAELVVRRSIEDPVLIGTQDSGWVETLGARRMFLGS